MFRPKKKRVLQIAAVLVILSVVIFVFSAMEIHSSVSTHTQNIGPSSSLTITRSASAGYFLEYSITSTPSNHSLMVYLVSPAGFQSKHAYYNNTNGGSSVFIANSTGNWTLVVTDVGHSSASVTASFGSINQNVVYLTILGFVSIISGIALFSLYAYSRSVQKKRERLRDFSE